MSTYKTKDGSQTGFVPGVGAIVDGLLKNAPDNLENANLVKVETPIPSQPPAPAAPAASPSVNPAPMPATPTANPINKETE